MDKIGVKIGLNRLPSAIVILCEISRQACKSCEICEICVRPKSAHTRAHKKARLQNRAVLFYLYNVWIIFLFWEPLWCKPC